MNIWPNDDLMMTDRWLKYDWIKANGWQEDDYQMTERWQIDGWKITKET